MGDWILNTGRTVLLAVVLVWVLAHTFLTVDFEKQFSEIQKLDSRGQAERYEQLLEKKLSAKQRFRLLEPAASAFCVAGKSQYALRLLDEAFTEESLDDWTRARLFKLRCWAHRGLGNFEEALRDNTKALELTRSVDRNRVEPSFLAQFYTQRAWLLSNMDRKQEAIGSFQEAVLLDPCQETCRLLFEAACSIGDYGAALTAWLQWIIADDAVLPALHAAGERLVDGLTKEHAPDVLTMLEDARPRMFPRLAMQSERSELFHLVFVKVLLANGRHTEALQEAMVLLNGCSDPMKPEAVTLIQAAVKGIDGNLGRVNEISRYATFGAAGEDGIRGTKDDWAKQIEQYLKSAD